jgi:hypothetical protein
MSDKIDNRRGEGGFTSLDEILPGLEGLIPRGPTPTPAPLQEAKAASLQGKQHFTKLKQIDALVEIGLDGNPEMGFMTRLLTLCSLPRTDPGDLLQFKRQNGPYKLVMIAGGDNKLPFGNLPRLLLAWVSTEAVRTQRRDIVLGPSLASFMRQLGMHSDGGGERGDLSRLKKQIDRLFNAHVQLIYEVPGRKTTASSAVADYTELWWDYKQPRQDTLWESRIRLGEAFFSEIVAHPIPLDMRILKQMKRSSLGLDLYMWLGYKTYALYTQGKGPQRLSWRRLYQQFDGNSETRMDEKEAVKNFRRKAIRELKKLKIGWRTLDYRTPEGCLEIRPCPPSIPPKQLGN